MRSLLRSLVTMSGYWFTAHFAATLVNHFFALSPEWDISRLFMFWAGMAYMRILLMGLSK